MYRYTKRTYENLTIKDLVDEWMKRGHFTEKIYNEKVIAIWDGMVGPIISKETEQIFIKNKVLIVRLKSHALRHEMEFARKKLVKLINDKVGRDVLIDVNFI